MALAGTEARKLRSHNRHLRGVCGNSDTAKFISVRISVELEYSQGPVPVFCADIGMYYSALYQV